MTLTDILIGFGGMVIGGLISVFLKPKLEEEHKDKPIAVMFHGIAIAVIYALLLLSFIENHVLRVLIIGSAIGLACIFFVEVDR